jgi:uncharacterized protein
MTAEPLPEQAHVIPCGDEAMVAVLHPGTRPQSELGVLVIVGGPQYRVGSHRQFVLMARDLAAAGYPVMRFDYRGMGDAGGALRNFEAVDEDIRVAVDAFVGALPSLRRIVLWGLCDAASAALMYCQRDARVSAMVVANPWVRTDAGEAQAMLNHYYGNRLLQWSFWKKALSGGVNPMRALREFTRVLVNARGNSSGATAAPPAPFLERMRTGAERFGGRVLWLISGRDLTAQEFMAVAEKDERWLRAMANPRFQLVRLRNADHTFSGREDLRRATAACRDFLDELCASDASPGVRSWG